MTKCGNLKVYNYFCKVLYMCLYVCLCTRLHTSVARPFLCDDVQQSLKSVFKCHNLLDGSVSFSQLLQQEETLKNHTHKHIGQKHTTGYVMSGQVYVKVITLNTENVRMC